MTPTPEVLAQIERELKARFGIDDLCVSVLARWIAEREEGLRLDNQLLRGGLDPETWLTRIRRPCASASRTTMTRPEIGRAITKRTELMSPLRAAIESGAPLSPEERAEKALPCDLRKYRIATVFHGKRCDEIPALMAGELGTDACPNCKLRPAVAQQIREAEEAVRARKDAAYEERNRVVAALASFFPSGIARTAIEGWDPEWHGCVYIDLPTGQVSWHYHDSHAHLFAHLPPYMGVWDGHDTPEKYRRVASLPKQTADEKVAKERARVLRLLDAPLPTDGMRTGALDPRTDHRTKRFLAKLRDAIESGATEL